MILRGTHKYRLLMIGMLEVFSRLPYSDAFIVMMFCVLFVSNTKPPADGGEP